MKKNVVVIGGGTGTVAVLSGLKRYPDLAISVIVSMTDDGGSNAVVRDEFGLLPLSDLRKSIIALSDSDNHVLRDLFMYRFSKGNGLSGHTLGNLVMMALSDISGSEEKAVAAASILFKVHGNIIPVTLGHTHLVAEYDNGLRVKGEHLIDEPEKIGDHHISMLSLTSKVKANPSAVRALLEADYIVAGPGDLYTSTMANIIVPGIATAIKKSQAKFIFISNLMTKQGQTHGMRASDMVREITRYAKRSPDIVVLHEGSLPKKMLKKYAARQEFPVEDDIVSTVNYKIIRANVVGEATPGQKGDTLLRSLVRHDASRISKLLYPLFVNKGGYLPVNLDVATSLEGQVR